MKTFLMKFNSSFLKLIYSLGEINTNQKMISYLLLSYFAIDIMDFYGLNGM